MRALGLTHGPVHAEFRVNEQGPGCSKPRRGRLAAYVRARCDLGQRRKLLEEMLVRHALGLPGSELEREDDASGVMMIPVPKTGVLESVEGEEQARATPGIEDVQITARLHDFIAAWPEGSSYLGFIFARGNRRPRWKRRFASRTAS